MKTILSVFFLAVLMLSCQSKAEKDKNVDLSPLTITMDVHGMTCNGCVETVRASVAQLGDAINSVSVDLEESHAVIEYSPADIDSVTIRKAIELNGYKVLAVKKKE